MLILNTGKIIYHYQWHTTMVPMVGTATRMKAARKQNILILITIQGMGVFEGKYISTFVRETWFNFRNILNSLVNFKDRMQDNGYFSLDRFLHQLCLCRIWLLLIHSWQFFLVFRKSPISYLYSFNKVKNGKIFTFMYVWVQVPYLTVIATFSKQLYFLKQSTKSAKNDIKLMFKLTI